MDAAAGGEVCLVNIGPRGRRRRMTFGVVGLAAGVALGVALVVLHVHAPWRLAALLPLWIGAYGVFQARAKT
ncbi:MAG TPA: hypothetical protein VG389_19985 [Myxococcota bacterium]|jgi:uncharacterized membrane protein YccC|nr:hypothetical protein [Myxococcota bacterium]